MTKTTILGRSRPLSPGDLFILGRTDNVPVVCFDIVHTQYVYLNEGDKILFKRHDPAFASGRYGIFVTVGGVEVSMEYAHLPLNPEP